MVPALGREVTTFLVFKFHGKSRSPVKSPAEAGTVFPALFLASCLRLTPRYPRFPFRYASLCVSQMAPVAWTGWMATLLYVLFLGCGWLRSGIGSSITYNRM
jgi:hypothetical protein